ncbi:tRNA uridine(34) 5-carboxymethylaminomethyl modification radical SAM/GNAT enzyme Elp3 [Candidatus Woesearchaeota archaeon]|nr:tRNA uridine(34) 5-carboxymethylaminomethyl modification radical SAM/GNAT enzyme Elp3 [Candidatus Woesearchaeota archaeon]MBL7050914.1 tRNA uridine(34) 5-carboxymethylaminomethyl modification radical SAM/GNAT enzyme Elp3 [Candidatus Woesearchaeota archaeon]
MKEFYKEIINIIKEKNLNKEQITKLKLKLCSKYKLKKIPTDIEILLNTKPKDISKLKQLQTKPVRTISGVAIIAIMTKPFKCPHGKCIMCPGGPDSFFGDIPQSYTGKEPATMRGIRNHFDPYLQVMNRLEQYAVLGHNFEKIELIVMGGTFPSFPKKYKEDFILYSFKAMNDFSKLFFKNNKLDILKFKKFFELPHDINDEERKKRIHKKLLALKTKKTTTIEKEQKINENSDVKCVGLTIETRPDYATLEHANELLRFGCTRIELGVQTTSNKTLNFIKRGHTIEDSIKATTTLKELGFKINYHMMPGLPFSNKKTDLKILNSLFTNQNFQPDMLKLYPCMVLPGTELYKLWKQKKFKPITTKQAAEMLIEFKKNVPPYVRIMRVQRDIPTYATSAGVSQTNLRQSMHQLMEKKQIKCNCIRCREPKKENLFKPTTIIRIYKASNGTEFFISSEDTKKNKLLGFCRLRLPASSLRKEITKDSALIRELHIYGAATGIGKSGKVQHKGLGKSLLKKAEQIAKQNNKNKIVVISGVGVRNYYKKLGYKKQGPYMVKKLSL